MYAGNVPQTPSGLTKKAKDEFLQKVSAFGTNGVRIRAIYFPWPWIPNDKRID
jgi:hypothetical protein